MGAARTGARARRGIVRLTSDTRGSNVAPPRSLGAIAMPQKARGLRWRNRWKASIQYHEKRAINARRRAVTSSKASKREQKQAKMKREQA